MTETNSERSYIAFISYRHQSLDREAAERVQKRIENYIVPKEFREKTGGKKLGLCFRDEDELPASSSLTDSIYYALDHSKFLVVICTPDLPLSKWCEAEIKYFLKSHKRDHILAVLADGEPKDSFSPYMLHDFDGNGNIVRDWEPLAANIAGEDHTINRNTFKKETTRLCAAMIDCPFDALWQRERRAKTNRLLTAASAAVAVLAVFLGVVMNRNAQIAAQNEQILEQNDQITEQNNELAEKNEQIQTQNEQITEQNDQLQSQLSKVLVDSGLNKLENYDIKGALQDALAALESNDSSIYDHRAEKLLADALGAYQCGQLQSRLVYQQNTMITQIQITDDDHYAILLDHVGAVRCLDLSTYEIVWEQLVKDANAVIYTSGLPGSCLVKTSDQLLCFSISDGSLLWSYDQDSPNYFQCISDDGTLFVLLDTKEGEDGIALPSDTSRFPDTSYFRPVYAVILDTENGQELFRTELRGEDDYGFYHTSDVFREKMFATAFSPDNGKFICTLPFTKIPGDDNEIREYLYIIDMDSHTTDTSALLLSRTVLENIQFDIFLGAVIDNDAGNIYVIQNDSDAERIVINALRRDDGKYEHVTAEQNFYFSSDTLSLYDIEDGIHRTVPLLASDEHMVIFTDKSILICSLTAKSVVRNYTVDSNIISAEWIDKNEEIIQIITDRGSVLTLDLSTDENYALDSADQFYLEHGSLSTCASVNGGIAANKNDGACLLVPDTSANQLILLDYRTDPGVSVLEAATEESTVNTSTMIDFLPDSDTGMLFLNGKSVMTFDRKTGEILNHAEMKEEFKHGIQNAYMLDKTHFVQANRLYNTEDGSLGTYLAVPEELEDFIDAGLYFNKRLPDGSLLTTGMFYAPVPDESGESTRIMLAHCFWINDKYKGVSFLVDATDSDISLPVIGENGMIALCGDQWLIDGTEPSFKFLDSANELIYDFPRDYPEDISCITALGTRVPIAALLYENGEMHLINFQGEDLQNNTIYHESTERFSSLNEALAMCFSEEDQYLLMLSSAGRLLITDLKNIQDHSEQTGEQLINTDYRQDVIDIFKKNIHDYDNFIRADLSGDEKTMYIFAGYAAHFCNAVFMDTDTWTLRAEVADIYDIDEENNKVYAYTNNVDGKGTPAIVTYPIHTLEDLKEWAEEVLAE